MKRVIQALNSLILKPYFQWQESWKKFYIFEAQAQCLFIPHQLDDS